MPKPTAGDLVYRVAFDVKGMASDGAGGTTTAFSEQFQCRAGFVHLRGGESVQAARLQGQHPQIIRVRSSSLTRNVTTDWRIRDVRSGDVFNIRDITPGLDRQFIDFLCQKGVAA
ncbi:phage head closure protein [Mesorhizobium loti]|uniref:Phage head-tail adapter protein n=1 Tax=Rhizobium loti TaxID=381 RepID=A0A6M7U3Z0_RHILI|nr:phage head closure protein [Mesorhizobium loti]OBQ72394.1 phage head-tail adapter protein [Mesorhizobium loti]QKC72004.1 head-tail adaptor protein [Mesorhizobium loti]